MKIPNWQDICHRPTLIISKHDRPLVFIKIIVHRGLIHDPQDKQGLFSLTCDYMLWGTKQHNRSQFNLELERLGASIDFDVGYHSTIFDVEVLSHNLDKVIELIKNLFTSPLFNPLELEKLKKDISSEIHLQLENDSLLTKMAFERLVYNNHPYGQDELGSLQSIENIQYQDIVQCHQDTFSQDLLSFGFAGDTDLNQAEKVIQAILKNLPSSSKLLEVTFNQTKRPYQTVVVDKPERSQSHFLLGFYGPSILNPLHLPLQVFFTAFAGPLFQAQYMQEIRVKRGWSYGAYGTLDLRRHGGLMYLYTYVKIKDTLAAIDLSIDLFKKAVFKKGLPKSLHEFTKHNLIKSFPFQIDIPEKLLQKMIFNKFVGLGDEDLALYTSRIESVTYESSIEAAKEIFDFDQMHTCVLTSIGELKNDISKAYPKHRLLSHESLIKHTGL